MLTTPEAQKFLAEQLKEKIQFFVRKSFLDKPGILVFQWKDKIVSQEILDTEWDYIARLVEGKVFLQGRAFSYENILYQMWARQPKVTVSQMDFNVWLIKLDYVTRATALKQTIGEE